MLKISDSTFSYNDYDYNLILDSMTHLLNNNKLGFLQLPFRQEEWDLAKEYASYLNKEYKKFIILGMGGSSLGGKCIVQAISPESKSLEFWDSIDPLFLNTRLNAIESYNDTHWICISKSGNTLETLTLINYVHHFLENKGINLFNQSTFITENKPSPLTSLAKKHNIPILPHPKDVGGRFSVFSIVGLLPAALIGANLEQIQLGARHALEKKDLIAELCAYTIESWGQRKWVTNFWPYDYSLKGFVRWVQQLWAESLAKSQNNLNESAPRVSTPMYCLGSREQHSVLQQFADGYKDKLIIFYKSKKASNETFLNHFNECTFLEQHSLETINLIEIESCIESLKEKGATLLVIEYEEMNELTIGTLLFSFELAIGCLGEFLNINAYDQPGVELGKKIAIDKLSQKV